MSAENRYLPGQIICYQGEAMRFLYILKAGAVEVILNDPADRPLSLDVIQTRGQRIATIQENGALVGEMGALLKTRSATLRAGSQGAVLQPIPLSEDGLVKAILNKPSLGVGMARTMAERLRANNDRSRRLLLLHDKVLDGSREYARRFYELSERMAGVYRGRPSMMTLVKVTQATASFEAGKQARRVVGSRPDDDGVVPGQEAVSSSGPAAERARQSMVEFEKDAYLFRRGETGDALFVVLEGRLAVEIEDHEVDTVEKGGIVGEMAVLLDENLRTATVRAVEKSRLLVVERDRFEEVVESMPSIAVGLVRILTDRIRNSNTGLFEARNRLVGGLRSLGEVVDDFATFRQRLTQYRDQPIDISEALSADHDAASRFKREMDVAARDVLRESEIPRR